MRECLNVAEPSQVLLSEEHYKNISSGLAEIVRTILTDAFLQGALPTTPETTHKVCELLTLSPVEPSHTAEYTISH